MSDYKHRCTYKECPFFGQVTGKSCRCHVDERGMMLAHITALGARCEAMQHVVNMASLLNNPDDDAGDDEDDYETMIELYFAVQEYRKALALTASDGVEHD